jgi:hypothetical protein
LAPGEVPAAGLFAAGFFVVEGEAPAPDDGRGEAPARAGVRG